MRLNPKKSAVPDPGSCRGDTHEIILMYPPAPTCMHKTPAGVPVVDTKAVLSQTLAQLLPLDSNRLGNNHVKWLQTFLSQASEHLTAPASLQAGA